MSGVSEKKLLVVIGPTAVGKTDLTVKLAKHFNCIVINADSRQVFKEMKIGTARPDETEMSGVKHYFVGSHSLGDKFSAGIFEAQALDVLKDEYKRSNLAILSGGSGLYVQAVCEGLDSFPAIDPITRKELENDLAELGLEKLVTELYEKDPVYWKKVDKQNSQRVLRALEVVRTSGLPYSSFRTSSSFERNFNTIKIGLDRPREELYNRINSRMDQMMEEGLFKEVESLQDFKETRVLQTVGYQEVFRYMHGDYDKAEAIRLLKRNSRRFAKRQLTWFRRDKDITWLV